MTDCNDGSKNYATVEQYKVIILEIMLEDTSRLWGELELKIEATKRAKERFN